MSTKLQELCRFDIGYARQVSFRLEWSANTLTILTDRGIELFDLSCNICSYNKRIELLSCSLPCAQRAPDSPLWDSASQTVNHLPVITSFAWSPPDVIYNFSSVLAVLTSYGSVTLHARRRLGCRMLIDLTSILIKSKNLKKSDNTSITRELIMEIESSALCWGSMSQPHSCYFLTGHRNGRVIFWAVTSINDQDEIKAEVVHQLETDIGEINTMTWIPKDQDTFAYLCSGKNGVIKIYDCRIDNDKIIVKDSRVLWPYRDLMVLNHITWFKSGNNHIIVCAKHRHILIFLVSSTNELLCQYANNVNDFNITGLTKTRNNNVYIGSKNGVIFRVNIIVEQDKLRVELDNVSIKEDFSEYIFNDIASSTNDAIWTISLVRKPVPRRFKLNVTIIFFKSVDFNSIEAILENPSQSLTYMWDCVELLRLECAKDKRLPKINIEKIFSDPNISTYYMKVYLILSKLHHNYTIFNYNTTKSILDSLSADTIRDTLLVRHAVKLADALYQLYQESGKQLKTFQRQVFLGCCHYIETYCNRYKNDLSSYINREALIVAKAEHPDFAYRCTNCGGNLVDLKCSCGHPNQFCMVSLQPLDQEDYLVCRVCGGTACVESYLEKPMCIFCDVFLEQLLNI